MLQINQNKRGISLIALVITIIVMIILATVAIIELDERDMLYASKHTANKTKFSDEKQNFESVRDELLLNNLGSITIDEYIVELQQRGLIKTNITVEDDGSKSVTTKNGYILNILQEDSSNLTLSLGESNINILLSPNGITETLSTNETKTVTIIPSVGDILGDLSWTSTNEDVVRIVGGNEKAVATIVGVGTAEIIATYGNVKVSCVVSIANE